MREMVSDFVAGCKTCGRAKQNWKHSQGNRKHIEIKDINEYIFIDHFGELPASSYGYKHILVILEGFSKFIKLYPVKSTNTLAVIKRIKEYQEVYTKDEPIQNAISDNGPAFRDSYKKEMKKLGINAYNTSSYNLPCNLAERQMSCLGDYLQTVIFDQNKKHNQWYELLPDIEKALNEVEYGTTLEAPNEVITGEPLEDEIVLLLGVNPREVDREKTKNEINLQLQKANSRTINQGCGT